MAKRLNKNDITRGRIFDQIASLYGGSVLGFYEGKLRIELIDEETGLPFQFSLAPTLHKNLIDDVECDEYVNTDDRIAEYQASLKKNEEKAKPKKKKVKKEVVQEEIKTEDFNFEVKETAATSNDEEQAKLDALMAELNL